MDSNKPLFSQPISMKLEGSPKTNKKAPCVGANSSSVYVFDMYNHDNKKQINRGILDKTIRKPEKVAKRTKVHLKLSCPAYN